MYRSKIVEREDGLWITNLPECEDCGPYELLDDALIDMKGLLGFSENKDDWEYITGLPEVYKPIPEPGRFRLRKKLS